MKTKRADVSYYQYMSLESLYHRLLEKNARLQEDSIDLHNQIVTLKKKLTARKTVDKKVKRVAEVV